FYDSFFYLSKESQATFLGRIKETLGSGLITDWAKPVFDLSPGIDRSISDSMQFLVYSAWHKDSPEEKKRDLKNLSYKYAATFLSNLPPNIPAKEMLLLADAVIKDPYVLTWHVNGQMGSFIPSMFVPRAYKVA